MNEQMNATSTANVIREIASAMRDVADRLDRQAAELEKDGDFEHRCPTALNLVINLFNNIRLDLLITRPLREFQKALVHAEEKNKSE